MSDYKIQRRSRIDLQTPAEAAIRAAMEAVEAAGADVLLTDAVILLDNALDKVGEFTDQQLLGVLIGDR